MTKIKVTRQGGRAKVDEVEVDYPTYIVEADTMGYAEMAEFKDFVQALFERDFKPVLSMTVED